MDVPAKPSPRRPPPKRGKQKPAARRKSGGMALNIVILGVLTAFIWVFRSETAKVKEAKHLDGYNYYEVYPHYETPPGTPALNVMFVGNSYTIVNNLPFMIQAVAASDTAAPVVINPVFFGKGGVTLKQLWALPGGQEKLASQHWDYVVLQDMSVLPSSPGGVEEMREGITSWDAAVKAAGSRTMLYETWARKAGSDWYSKQKYPDLDLVSPAVMQEKVDEAYNSFASEIGASLVPAGDYWAMCEAQPGAPDFYNKDGTHPNFAGDYLVALLFYRALTGHKLDHVSYVAPGLTPEQAALIRKCASYGGS